jgi:guanylate kinase
MKRPGLLLVLSAPSGAGKTTICAALLATDRGLARSVSATTREPRGREQDGRDYYFWSAAAFRAAVRRQAFLEWAWVHGHRYGTLRAEVARLHRAGRDVIMVIDVQGGLSVKRRFPEAVLIFVKPPSFAALAARLRRRGTDCTADIRGRLKNARWELSLAPRYEYQVVNARLGDAVTQVRAIITAERLRTRRSKPRVR